VLADKLSRPSRVDVAFDLEVPESYLSDHFIADYCPMGSDGRSASGHNIGISGSGHVNTRYVGSITSERRVRVYRKDLESAAYGRCFGPTLRVELVLKDRQAWRWWQVWQAGDKQAAWKAAALVVESMTGYNPMPGGSELPELDEPDGLGEAEKAAWFVKTYGAMLVALKQAGLDVMGWAERLESARSNRMAASRLARRVAALKAPGVAGLVEGLLFGGEIGEHFG
jgi:hypothetical protein